MFGLKGNRIQTRLGNGEFPSNPLPGLAEAPSPYGVEANLGWVVGFHGRVPQVGNGKEGGLGPQQGVFSLDFEEDACGGLRWLGFGHLPVGGWLFNLADRQTADDNGFLVSDEPDYVGALLEIE